MMTETEEVQQQMMTVMESIRHAWVEKASGAIEAKTHADNIDALLTELRWLLDRLINLRAN
jgi:hypothetical protein